MNDAGFCVMDDFDFSGKKVLVRCDFNSPLGENGEILEFMRIKVYKKTFDKLKNAKVVAISHQGRLGNSDCVSLANHAKVLAETIEQKVTFINDLLGDKAKKAIDEVGVGEVVVLENTRFQQEDNENATPEQHSKSDIVRTLAPRFDYFINDAFSVSHRSQASVVGFPLVLPSCAGLVVEREMEAMYEAVKPDKKPAVYCIGGKKFKEVIKVMEVTLNNGTIEKALVGGSVAHAFLYVRGLVPKECLTVMEEKGDDLTKLIERAKKLDDKFKDKIILPSDIAISFGGREEAHIGDSRLGKYIPLDIGESTIAEFTEVMKNAKAIISKGPMGAYENPIFLKGTVRTLINMENSPAYSLIGGGHMGSIAFDLGIRVDHISTAGGAVLAFMSGEPLPGIEVLKQSAKIFQDKLK
jgi:phosphoglycerate kinase